MVSKAVMDSQFYQQVPEFLPIQMKLIASKEPQRRGGCGSCRQRRMMVNISQDFSHTLSSLSLDAVQRLKAYFGVTSIMYHSRGTAGKPELKIV